jgi:hypothetical protein
MKATEIIAKLKLAFDEMVNPNIASVKMVEAKLQDGTVVEVTALEVGGIVTIQGVPAPAGEHILEDGTKIVLDDKGVILEIMPAENEVEIEIEAAKKKAKMEEVFSAFETATNQKFASYEAKFAAYENKFSEYETKLNKAYGVIEGLIELTQKLAETPTATPDQAVKVSNNFNEEKPKFNYDVLFGKK